MEGGAAGCQPAAAVHVSDEKPEQPKPPEPASSRPHPPYTGSTIRLRPDASQRSNTPLTPDELDQVPQAPAEPRMPRQAVPAAKSRLPQQNSAPAEPRMPRQAPPPAESRVPVPRRSGTEPLRSSPAARPVATPATRLRPLSRRPLRFWHWVRTVLLLLSLLLLIGLGIGYWQLRGIEAATLLPDRRPDAPIASPLLGGYNVLLIGVDERPDHPEEGVRSDTLIVAHVDTGGRWVSLLSIPRDSLVQSEQLGETKVNAVYGYGYNNAAALFGAESQPREGGMALSAQVVEQFLGLEERGQHIHYMAQVNFDGFAQIVDALGGIMIDVPQRIVDEAYPTPDFGTMRVEFEAGLQQMNGERALIYARTRHADSDFGRAQRQQQVIRAIVDRFRELGPLGQLQALPGLQRGLENTLATTLPVARPDVLLGLIMLASGLNPDEIGQYSLNPQDVALSEFGSDLVWDPTGVRAQVARLFEPPGEAREAARVQVLNGTDIGGLAGQTTNQLQSQGFNLLAAGDAPPGEYPRTVVYDLTGKPRTAQRLAAALEAELRSGPLPQGLISEADLLVILGEDRRP